MNKTFNNFYIKSILFLFVLSASQFVHAQTTYYVKIGGSGTGASWIDAFGHLQSALDVAVEGDQIWVAEGVYFPIVQNPNNNVSGAKDRTFYINTDISIYGGFAGTENTLADRGTDLSANKTILSGDIDSNDNTDADGLTSIFTGVVGENVLHVLSLNRVSDNMLLDRFYITGGQADGDAPNDGGGGIYNEATFQGNSSNPVIKDCTLVGNIAEFGGAIFNNGVASGQANPTVLNCFFMGNFANVSGGAIFNHGYNGNSSPMINQSTFQTNFADFGGAIYNDGIVAGLSNPSLLNCTFAGNHADQEGGAIYNDGRSGESSTSMINCIFRGNRAVSNGGGMIIDARNLAGFPQGLSNSELINCIFSGNLANVQGGGVYINGGNTAPNSLLAGDDRTPAIPEEYQASINMISQQRMTSSTLISNTIIWNNKDNSGVGTADASIFNSNGVVTIHHSLIEGQNPTGIGNLDGTDMGNDPLFPESVDPNNAPSTSGNLESDDCSPTINAGSTTYLPSGVTTDILENARIVSVVDMGAYEYQGNITCGLPLEWLSFQAQLNSKNQAVLVWKTAQEINVSHYEIEWSVDGQDFKTLTHIAATGHANSTQVYEWTHRELEKGNNYYRIKQLDNNGAFSYSDIQMVNLDKIALSVYPNPSTEEVFIQTQASPDAPQQARLFNAAGQLVLEQFLSSNVTSIDVQSLPTGLYFLHLVGAAGTQVEQIIKQ